MTTPPPREAGFAASGRWLIPAMGLLSLAPLIVYHALFARLFWFGDEFDLIDQIDRLGFWTWLGRVFAENFVPLFKLLWGGGVFLFHGSYAAMVVLVWLTHACNVVLLGRVMRTYGVGWFAVLFAQAVFGLTSGNLETLAWTVQWSAVLSVTFMLIAFERLLATPFTAAAVLGSAASALSFSRGVLTGPLVVLGSLFPEASRAPVSAGRRLAFRAGCLISAAAVALLIDLMARGNHHHMAGHLAQAAAFGAWYYCLNPAHDLFSVESMGWHTVVILGLGKVALIAWTLARSWGRPRMLFALLVAFDLGNAALLGIGRFHTGYPATVSSRYQYASLIGILPLAGYWLEAQWDRLPVSPAQRRAAAMVALGIGIGLMCRNWSGVLDSFTVWRGTDSRQALVAGSEPGPVPGIPTMTRERARELIARYHLH
jgi:hypothetical protein